MASGVSFILPYIMEKVLVERKYVIIRICPQLYFSDTLFS